MSFEEFFGTDEEINASHYSEEAVSEDALSRYKNIESVRFQAAVAGTTFVKTNEKVLPFLRFRTNPKDIILMFEREKDNPYDKNAVVVKVTVRKDNGKLSDKVYKVGYVEKGKAPVIAEVLDNPKKYKMEVTEVLLFGGENEKKNIGIRFSFTIKEI